MDDNRFSFEKLDVYQEARELVREVYILHRQFPAEEKYALGDQIRRSISSVTSNLAEGSGRTSFKDKIYFIQISYGSLMESFCQLQTAVDLNYINQSDLDQLRSRFIRVARQLSGLKSAFENKLSHTP